ncbi:MAG: hypothetical protein ACYSUX_00360 [Planctomycetota bacterium]|jgi:hypothetical protein
MAMTKIYKGETPLEELQQAFKDELEGMLKDAAVRLKCPVERLKCQFNNMGMVEVQEMTEIEMLQKQAEDAEKKRIYLIKNRRKNG